MTTPSGDWIVLNPNPFLSSYPNYTVLRPHTGEFGFAVYFCAPADADNITLVFVKPTYPPLVVTPFLAFVPNILYIPGRPVWCYVIQDGDLDEGGTYQVYIASQGRRVSNSSPLQVLGPTLPPVTTMPTISSAYTVVSPSGGDDTGMLNDAFAQAAILPVFLSAGTYLVSSPVTVPPRGIVVGEDIDVFEFYDGFTTYAPVTVIQAIDPGLWTPDQGILVLSNYAYIRGFTVRGTFKDTGHDLGLTCIDASNSHWATIDRMQAFYAKYGIDVSGAQGLNVINKTRVQGNTFYGIAGGILTDARIIDVMSNANGLGEFHFNQLYVSQIQGCRIEDSGGFGLELGFFNAVLIANNFFDRNNGTLSLAGDQSRYLTFIGNRSLSNSAYPDVVFQSTLHGRYIKFGLNDWASDATSIFTAESGCTLQYCVFEQMSQFVDAYNLGPGQTLFTDTTSDTILSPFVIARGPPVANQGVTANRPTSNRAVGVPFFDTTLGKPIWWTGSLWVDATGASV